MNANKINKQKFTKENMRQHTAVAVRLFYYTTHSENRLDFFHSGVSKTNSQIFRLISFHVSGKNHI